MWEESRQIDPEDQITCFLGGGTSLFPLARDTGSLWSV